MHTLPLHSSLRVHFASTSLSRALSCNSGVTQLAHGRPLFQVSQAFTTLATRVKARRDDGTILTQVDMTRSIPHYQLPTPVCLSISVNHVPDTVRRIPTTSLPHYLGVILSQVKCLSLCLVGFSQCCSPSHCVPCSLSNDCLCRPVLRDVPKKTTNTCSC